MDYRGLMRRKLLEDIYDKMSDEEKRTFVQLTMQDKGHEEILKELRSQNHELEDIHSKVERQTWLSDLSSNIVGNAAWDAFVWLGSRLLRKL